MAISLNQSLFIGLGGTGVKTLIQTKKLFLENYGRDGEIPPMIRFLAFDTDQYEIERGVEFGTKEMYLLKVPNPEAYCGVNKLKVNKWLPEPNKQFVQILRNGAGQVRTNGRFAFMYHLNDIKIRIRQALLYILSYNQQDDKWHDFYTIDSPINVNLVFSLCGGTGSGMFLDMAYLVQRLSKELNMRVKINAYAVMPGIFDQSIMQSCAKPRIFSNAYAAIRETDYLMDMMAHHNTVNINWNGDRFETSEPPFNTFVMVDNRNNNGVVLMTLDKLAAMLSTFLFTLSSSSFNLFTEHWAFSLRWGELNVLDKQAWVSAIGACTIVYKNEDVASVYRDKVINKIIRQMLQDEDVNQEALIWMKVAQIEEHDGDDVIEALASIHIPSIELNENDINRRTAETYIDTAFDNYRRQVVPSDEQLEIAVQRLLDFVKSALDKRLKIMIDTEGRVKAADRLLDEIKSRIDCCFVPKLMDEMNAHQHAKEHAEVELTFGKHYLLDLLSRPLHFLKRKQIDDIVNDIKASMNEIVCEEIEIKRRSYAISFYTQLSELIANYKNQIYSLIASLETLMEENEVDLRNRLDVNAINRNEINLSINDIRNMEVDVFPYYFGDISSMLPNQSFLLDTNTEELRNAFTSFSNDLPQMHSIMDRTIDDVLNEMSENKFNEVISCAIDRAAPFLRVDDSYHLENGTIVGSHQFVSIGVPDEYNYRINRITNNIERGTTCDMRPIVFSTGLKGQIMIYRYMLPVPAYAVTALDMLHFYYDRNETICPHIDVELQKRMTEEQFDIQPRKTEYYLDKNEE